MAAGGFVGACGGGDALPTRPVQVHIGVGVTCLPCGSSLQFFSDVFYLPEEKGASLFLSARGRGDVGWSCCVEINLVPCSLFLSSQLACSFVMSIFGLYDKTDCMLSLSLFLLGD